MTEKTHNEIKTKKNTHNDMKHKKQTGYETKENELSTNLNYMFIVQLTY